VSSSVSRLTDTQIMWIESFRGKYIMRFVILI
jgi:hypothetical protein